MLWASFVVLLILWLLGWEFGAAGSMIHLLFVLATLVAILNLVKGGRKA